MRKGKAASPRRTRASRENSARKAAQARGLGITRRGDLGEVAFVHKAMSLGYVVASPTDKCIVTISWSKAATSSGASR